MAHEELKKYIQVATAAGLTIEKIAQNLINAGWKKDDVLNVLQINQTANVSKKTFYTQFLYGLLILLIIIFCGSAIYLWQISSANNQKRPNQNSLPYPNLVHSKLSFINSEKLIFPDQIKFLQQKEEYIERGISFIEANLKNMELTLYKQGIPQKTFKILAKGKPNSWWETPTGKYKILSKSINSYSYIGNVWMPYSIHFYGNYLIHGWPYYEDGKPVPTTYSGGCIRLSTEDAKEIFNFAEKEMPILILGEEKHYNFGTLIPKKEPSNISVQALNISAKSFLIANLASGDILIEKNYLEKLPIASLTKLMTAVVAHEIIYLGKHITVPTSVLNNRKQETLLINNSTIFEPTAGKTYLGLDLLYPLLMQSSNPTADILAASFGTKLFITNMNKKAESLEMNNTTFTDPSGRSAYNISTANDLLKLTKYIYYVRPFLWQITKGIPFDNIGAITLGQTIDIKKLKNFNEFIANPMLIGGKNGETDAADQTIITLWNIPTKQGEVPIAIIILGSKNRADDTRQLLLWLKNNYETISINDISTKETAQFLE
jgi:D-alanyl-D-alanine carboxypeptidase